MYLPGIFLFAVAAQHVVAFPQIQRPQQGNSRLVPAVRLDHDETDVNHLIPQTRKRLYYSERAGRPDPKLSHKFLDMDADFKHNTVVLEHSKYISAIKCNADHLQVTFDNKKAFNLVQNVWKGRTDDLTFVTYKEGCGTSMNKRSFFVGSPVSFMKSRIGGVVDIKATEVDVRDELEKASVGWGAYRPEGKARGGRHAKRFGSWNETIEGPDIPIDLGFPDSLLTDSPWGPAFELIKEGDDTASLTVYCVDCGITGSMQLSGSAVFSILHGLESLAAKMTGDMTANMAIGMDAKITLSKTWEQDLATVTPPFLSVEGLFYVGPELTLKGSMEVTVTAEGTMLGGSAMHIGPFSGTLDFVDSGNNAASGFDPTFTNRFEATGQMGASSTLGLPVELGIGVGIPPIDFDKTIAIVDTPGMTAEATYSVGDPSSSCDNGVAWDLKFVNKVEMNIFDADTIDISDWESPSLVDGCIPVG